MKCRVNIEASVDIDADGPIEARTRIERITHSIQLDIDHVYDVKFIEVEDESADEVAS